MFGVFGTRQSWIKFFSPLVEMAIQTDEHMSQEVGELGVFKYIHIYIYIFIYMYTDEIIICYTQIPSSTAQGCSFNF